MRNLIYRIFIVAALLACLSITAAAQNKAEVNVGVDFYNRYVWRGLDIAATPSIQPSIALSCGGFEFGSWGAYTLSNQASESDEIDFWLGYTFDLSNDASIGLTIIDYYFPNAGYDFFNFNSYDDFEVDEFNDTTYGGAHTIEIGASYTGPKSFPITISGFINFHNDEGNNTYFQVDYPVNVNGTDLTLFCGATGGSKENPYYYGADQFEFINLGVTANRDIVVSDSFTMPLSVSFVLNPNDEISYLLVGMSF